MAVVVLGAAVLALFVLTPLASSRVGPGRGSAPPRPETVLLRYERQLHLTGVERETVRRAVRRGRRVEDARLRPAVAAVAAASVAVAQTPTHRRLARSGLLVALVLGTVTLVVGLVRLSGGHPAAASVSLLYAVLYGLWPVSQRRGRARLVRAQTLNG